MVIFVNRQIELVMKTLVSLLCCTALTVGSASAQSYRVARAGAFEENGRVEVGIPTSPLAVDLTVEKEVVTVGPYARYAQKFLGVRGALSDKTLYSVKAARVALLDRDATTASEVPVGEVRATSYPGEPRPSRGFPSISVRSWTSRSKRRHAMPPTRSSQFAVTAWS